jgi:hypothetical protein
MNVQTFDAAIFKYLETLTKREEKRYAAAFAHAMVAFLGDSDKAAMETIDSARGIRAGRSARIRREIVQRGIC